MSNTSDKARLISRYIVGKNVVDLGSSEGKLHDFMEKYSNRKIKTVDSLGNPDIKADLNKKFPFKSGSVDTIIASELIEHLDSPFFFLNECKRILKKRGILILTTPNGMSLAEFQGFFVQERKLDYTGHIYSWHKKTLSRLVNKVGLKIVHFDHISFFWDRNLLFKATSSIFPILRPNLLFVLQKD